MDSPVPPPSRYIKIAFFLAIMAVLALASIAAFWVRTHAAAVERGGLSLAVLFLMYRAYVAPKPHVRSRDGLAVHIPGDLRYLLLAFPAGLIGSWAGQELGALGNWLICVGRSIR